MDVEFKKYFVIFLKEYFIFSNLVVVLYEIWVNE